VRGVVRWVQGADWEGVREGVEGAVGRVLGGGGAAGKGREVVEVEEVGRVGEEAVGTRLREGFDGVRVAAERKAARILAATRETKEEKTEHGIENAGKTAVVAVDAVKGAVQSGVETVKKAVGKAGEKQVGKDEGLTDVQRALRQRYQRSETAGSVKEALAQRYKKVD
jgi:altered-inheritance-of-mitochondria protein 5